MRGTRDLEERALELARDAAMDRHVYPDLIFRLDQVIQDAYRRGAENTAAELADAYCLYILDDDDLDSFRDALTERLPHGWPAPKRKEQEPSG